MPTTKGVKGKWTGGEWRRGRDEHGFKRCYTGFAIYSDDENTTTPLMIAETLGGLGGEEEANARLIAASKKLFRALLILSDCVRGEAESEEGHPILKSSVRLADNALSAALGEG